MGRNEGLGILITSLIVALTSAQAMAWSPSDGGVYLVCAKVSSGGGAVHVRSLPDGASVFTEQVGSNLRAVAADAEAGCLYWSTVSYDGQGKITRRDSRGRQTTFVDDLDFPIALAVDPQSGDLYWADQTRGTIERVDERGRGRSVIARGSPALGMWFDGAGRRLLWTEARSGSTAVIRTYDPETGALDERVVQGKPADLVTHPASGTLLWTDHVRDVVAAEQLTGARTLFAAEGNLNPLGIIAAPDGTLYWGQSRQAGLGEAALLALFPGEDTPREIGTLDSPLDFAIYQGTAPVAGRWLFYNDSAFDDHHAGINGADAKAIATDKRPLLPGEQPRFVHYSSYVHGINGLMIDLRFARPGLRVEDFTFEVSDGSGSVRWRRAPTPALFSVRPGEGVGGATRVVFTWLNGSIVGRWLKVTVRASGRTGLKTSDVFWFGNAPGETGNSARDAYVGVADSAGVTANQRNFANPAPITDRFDFDRDGYVGVRDVAIVREHGTNFTNALPMMLSNSPLTP